MMLNIAYTILLAEDNEDDAFLLQEAFRKAQSPSRLVTVRDGAEALAYLKGEEPFTDRVAHPFPDMLLLDLNLPGVNGFEVLEQVRRDERGRRLAIHVLTASARDADVQRAYDLGANSYVLKPSRVDELIAFVTALHRWHRFVLLSPQPDHGELARHGKSW